MKKLLSQSLLLALMLLVGTSVKAQCPVNSVKPDAFLGNDTSICEGPVFVLKPGETDTTVTYLWSDNSTGRSLDVTSSGIYYVTLTSVNGCVSTDTIEVMVNPNPPSFDLGPDTAFCEGNSIILHSGNIDTLATVLWSDNSRGNDVVADATGPYFAIVTNVYGCTASDTMYLEVWPLPEIDLGNDTSFCEGNSITLTIPVTGSDTVKWQNGSTRSSMLVDKTGPYFVRVKNKYGCENFDSIYVTVKPLPRTTGIYAYIQPNQSYQFVAQNVTAATGYLWKFGDGITATNASPFHTYSSPGVYYASLKLSNDCGDNWSYVTVDFKENPDPSGIDESAISSNLQLYPNPAKDIVWLENKSTSMMESIVVYNMLGQAVYQTNVENGRQLQLDVRGYASGMYTVKVNMANGLTVQKRFQISR